MSTLVHSYQPWCTAENWGKICFRISLSKYIRPVISLLYLQMLISEWTIFYSLAVENMFDIKHFKDIYLYLFGYVTMRRSNFLSKSTYFKYLGCILSKWDWNQFLVLEIICKGFIMNCEKLYLDIGPEIHYFLWDRLIWLSKHCFDLNSLSQDVQVYYNPSMWVSICLFIL